MSSSLVVVAIPREDDPIWDISSEKVPHLTILFLGRAEDHPTNEIASFVEHASGMMLSRFGLDVDRRGELGDDKADVLFFQDNWELPRLREFRSQLLKDNNIKKAYDSAPQFGAPQDWTPHLTLGYPDKPAKPTKERIYWVQFDRIAVWMGDYKGTEFILKNHDQGLDVAMAATAEVGREFLAHYGVKGMRWGVRKERDSAKGRSTTKKVAVGVGAVTVAAGAGFVAWKLGSSGKIPISAVKASKDAASVADFLSKTGSSASEISEAQKYAEMFLKGAGR